MTDVIESRESEFADSESALPCQVPKERYTTREFSLLEAARLWPRVWQVACHESEIAGVGDFLEYVIADQSILVVRAEADDVRAYFNVCPHRGNQLKSGCGNSREIRCHFHTWRFHLDGSIKDIPDAHDFDPGLIQPDAVHLTECQVGRWGGFVWINMDRDAEPLEQYLGAIPIESAHFEYDKMHCVEYRSTLLRANWKNALDAFSENYHHMGLHPQTLFYLDDTNFTCWRHGIHSAIEASPGAFGRPSPRVSDAPSRPDRLLAGIKDLADLSTMSEDDVAAVNQLLHRVDGLSEDVTLSSFFAQVRRDQAAAAGIDLSHITDNHMLLGRNFNIFPNFTTAGNALDGFVFRFRPKGLDPESCYLDLWQLERLPKDHAVDRKVPRSFHTDWRSYDGWGRILSQDMTNIERVQRGMRSEAFQFLRLGRQETCIRNFHRALTSYVE